MLGKPVTPNAPVEQWMSETGTDFTVESSPIYYRAGDTALQDDDRKMLYNSNAPDVRFGVVGKDFCEVQPVEIWQFYKELEQETGFRINGGGILKDRRLFVTATNDRSLAVGGHEIRNYLVGGTENGGGMATRISPTDIFPVCQNTLQMALSDNLKLSFTHRSPVDWKAIKRWVVQENETFDLYGELMRALFRTPVDLDQTAAFAKGILAPDWDSTKDDKVPRKLAKWRESATRGVGQREALNEGKPNAFWLLNAFTRYVDHDMQARSEENRTDSAQFGPGNVLKNAVLQQLIDDCVTKWGNPDIERVERELVAIR